MNITGRRWVTFDVHPRQPLFSKLDLTPAAEDHRRVLAVLTYVKAIGD